FVRCSRVNSHLYEYFEVCIPKPLNLTPSIQYDNDISINVIEYVGTAPAAFDLIPDPLIFFRESLKRLDTVDGKAPTQLMLPNTFLNCTGKLRFFDNKILYIDTPATLGFGGGLCFLQSNPNEWEFIASSAYNSYYELFA
ncbi:unnamed protein product, partial [Didymodactylos carnosus]